MRFYSTRNHANFVSAEQAIIANLCPKGGLYMPESIPENLKLREEHQVFSLAEIGFEVAKSFLSDSFTSEELETAARNAFNFEAPLHVLTERLSVLELTHGPSLAFKDFGARFMAECLSLIAQRRDTQYHVLTATSGDTGAAVAAALCAKPGINVTILFPYNRISPFQAGQMTKWGGNIKTIAVNGTFDDCQRMVKQAFTNQDLSSKMNLVSANSINISRLLAQMVYYIKTIKDLNFRKDLTFVVPSGNLGNLTAGVFAAKYMNSDCSFIAAHNNNISFPEYLESGSYKARESLVSYSNAMDVGAPSNFERLETLFKSNPDEVQNKISAKVVSDQETLDQIKSTYKDFGYLICPHTAVGLRAATYSDAYNIVLATAHPKKFSEVLIKANVPLLDIDSEEKVAPATVTIGANFAELLEVL